MTSPTIAAPARRWCPSTIRGRSAASTIPALGSSTASAARPACPIASNFPATSSHRTASARLRRKFLDFPIYAQPTVAGRWTTNNFERNASIGGDNNQVNVRADYNVSQNNRLIGRYTRFDSTNLPVDVLGNGPPRGDPFRPNTSSRHRRWWPTPYTFNSSTVLDARFGWMRWDFDRTPGQPGDEHCVDVWSSQSSRPARFPNAATESRQPFPAMNAGSNQVIGTGLIYADDYTYSLTPTLTKIAGNHTLKAGANLLIGEVNYFQNNNVGGTFTFANNPTALDGTNPAQRAIRSRHFLDRSAHRRYRTSHRISTMVAPSTRRILSRIPGR